MFFHTNLFCKFFIVKYFIGKVLNKLSLQIKLLKINFTN